MLVLRVCVNWVFPELQILDHCVCKLLVDLVVGGPELLDFKVDGETLEVVEEGPDQGLVEDGGAVERVLVCKHGHAVVEAKDLFDVRPFCLVFGVDAGVPDPHSLGE